MMRGSMSIAMLLLLAACNDHSGDNSQASSAKTDRARKEQKSILPAAAQTKRVALDELLVFDDPQKCDWSPTASAFIGSFLNYGGGKETSLGRLKPLPSKYRTAIGTLRLETDKENDLYIATLPVTATWHSLRLVQIESAVSGMDAWSNTLAFDEPFETVRATLNSLGFGFDKNGDIKRPGFYEGPAVKLLVDRQLTYLDCSQ